MRGAVPIKGPGHVQMEETRILALHSFLLRNPVLWCLASGGSLALLLDVHEEKGDRDFQVFVIVKPARGMTIRFLGSISARLLMEVV
jgi:hypothetical protein